MIFRFSIVDDIISSNFLPTHHNRTVSLVGSVRQSTFCISVSAESLEISNPIMVPFSCLQFLSLLNLLFEKIYFKKLWLRYIFSLFYRYFTWKVDPTQLTSMYWKFHIPYISTKEFAAFATLHIVNNIYAIIDMNFLLVYSKSKIPYLRATTF